MDHQLMALTSLDGRYQKKIQELNTIFSEYGLFKYRVYVECQWLCFLSHELKLFHLSSPDKEFINSISTSFSMDSAKRIKEIELTTQHDVKAVEYYIKEKLAENKLIDIVEWVHFGCTSEDINNTAYALMIDKGKSVLRSEFGNLSQELEKFAQLYKSVPMMSRTHGQPASPTTVGKEFVNFAWRVREELTEINNLKVEGKMNGATGNFNAHHFVFPEVDWIKSSEIFLRKYLGITPLKYTTQINPYNYISRILHTMIRLASIIIDLDRDVWTYISMNYFNQRLKKGEVGSSTMPHKVNPIDFENSEGNLGLAISLMEHLSVKLLNSRLQRDLTDSTVMRNLGAVFGYMLIGIKSSITGFNKLELNKEKIEEDLDNNLELLAEAIQTAMRVYNESNPYEKLKDLTRGTKIDQERLNSFIETLTNVPEDVRERMKKLRPHSYVGLAESLVEEYFKNKQ